MNESYDMTTVYAPCLGPGSNWHHKLHCAWYLAVSCRGWHSGYFLDSIPVSLYCTCRMKRIILTNYKQL